MSHIDYYASTPRPQKRLCCTLFFLDLMETTPSTPSTIQPAQHSSQSATDCLSLLQAEW